MKLTRSLPLKLELRNSSSLEGEVDLDALLYYFFYHLALKIVFPLNAYACFWLFSGSPNFHEWESHLFTLCFLTVFWFSNLSLYLAKFFVLSFRSLKVTGRFSRVLSEVFFHDVYLDMLTLESLDFTVDFYLLWMILVMRAERGLS